MLHAGAASQPSLGGGSLFAFSQTLEGAYEERGSGEEIAIATALAFGSIAYDRYGAVQRSIVQYRATRQAIP